MASYFAEIDENNIVLRVLVVEDEKAEYGERYLSEDLCLGGRWIQTYPDKEYRERYAGPGDIYDPEKDIFVFSEHGIVPYLMAWNGNTQPQSPSILIDSIPRSGNIFLSACINSGLTETFQRWGHLWQHNPESIEVGIANFDLVVVPIRNPLDSAGSWIAMTNTFDDDNSIMFFLQQGIQLFDKIIEHKENLFITKFEDFTTNPNLVLSQIAERLNTPFYPIDVDNVKQEILSFDLSEGNFYSLPIENKSQIDQAKDLVLTEFKYKVLVDTLIRKYEEIIS